METGAKKEDRTDDDVPRLVHHQFDEDSDSSDNCSSSEDDTDTEDKEEVEEEGLEEAKKRHKAEVTEMLRWSGKEVWKGNKEVRREEGGVFDPLPVLPRNGEGEKLKSQDSDWTVGTVCG